MGKLLLERAWTLGVAESLTGGLLAARIVAVPGASEWFRGAVVAYDSDVKRSLLGVGDGPVVTGEAAAAMAEGARRVLGADVGLATTGVAGPTEQEGRPVGTVVVGLALPGVRPRASSCACRATVSGSASWRRSRLSTSSGAGSGLQPSS